MRDFIKEKIGKRRIVILGFGMEGQSSLRYFDKIKLENPLLIADGNEKIQEHVEIQKLGIPVLCGTDYLDHLRADDFIIKSPGVPLRKYRPDLKSFSQTSLFLEYYQDQIIGITGTKGKSTTSTMMHRILEAQNQKSYLVGNIGQPAFDLIPQICEQTWIVYELSAHQLQCVRQGPQMAILLNLMPEHLDYFGSIEAYYQAKLNIFKNQNKGSFSFIHQKTQNKIDKAIACKLRTELREDAILLDGKILISQTDLKYLLGHHHLENIQALMELILFKKLDIAKALESIKNFRPLPHRQELLGEQNGLRFINDSISTIPQSAIQAIKAIEKVDYLILGGLDRGVNYGELVDYLKDRSFEKIFFLGKAGQRVLEELQEQSNKLNFDFSWHSKLQDIRNELLQISKGNVLLSPAAASYDAFINFEARGDYFRDIFSEISENN
ncbi:UDP-N-acetylmuramoyl-L-alanine--D-glutamate ligase [Lentimicrobium sp. S6]|uniref:UDP-N-acetylmuramoyl-L-alanine--D-glutamate ligase n=1 Tax=Lentimicrobium sp. S6 TaxID=2735872 RepID=UPI001555A278|nr:UDP-N-acetylmuramoyl-L-alanine--D-glutamate ligase [Lentimicrobium sp. S6]NPD47573.1 UDP-N-acetylmuramoyl-L-alanine--D-glutamate ligase [Lentimicrobium sp. S6]